MKKGKLFAIFELVPSSVKKKAATGHRKNQNDPS